MLRISTSERMLAHAFAWSKTIENTRKWVKSTFFIMHTRGSREALNEKRRKTKKKVCWSAIGGDSQKLVDTQMLVANLEFCFLFFLFFFSTCTSHVHDDVLWKTLQKKNKKEQNSKWAPSVWVSTSFWESPPIADQQTFFFVFLREPYLSLSCAWWKRYFLTHFQVFLIVFDHGNACTSMHSLVEIHNIWLKV